MDIDYSWIYLAIFLLIPLARIIPRFISKRRVRRGDSHVFEKHSDQLPNMYSGSQEEPKPHTKDMLVLGALNRGARTFERIQRDTGLESGELDKILENLEKDGLMSVHQKQGVFGTKIELFPTDKGFKEYYSQK